MIWAKGYTGELCVHYQFWAFDLKQKNEETSHTWKLVWTYTTNKYLNFVSFKKTLLEKKCHSKIQFSKENFYLTFHASRKLLNFPILSLKRYKHHTTWVSILHVPFLKILGPKILQVLEYSWVHQYNIYQSINNAEYDIFNNYINNLFHLK